MTDPRPTTAFAHASEAELARILDFYEVRWAYEPHRFPIMFDRSGNVLESFAPDFYLPDLDLYIELTTLKQRLVRKKNRKLRRLRELYPDTRVKLLYARDFRALMLKYGKLALADALSGSEGQATPARPRPGAGLPDPIGPAPGPEPAVAGPAAVATVADAGTLIEPPASPAEPVAASRRPKSPPIRRTRAEARARAAARSRSEQPAGCSAGTPPADPEAAE